MATDNDKDIFYDELEKLFDRMPRYNSKILLGYFNAKVGREEKYRPTIGKYSLHKKTNNNGERLTTFAISKNILVESTHLNPKTYTNTHGYLRTAKLLIRSITY